MVEDAIGVIGGLFEGIGGFLGDLIGGVVDAIAGMVGHLLTFLPEAPDLNLSVTGGWVQGYALINSFLPLSEGLVYAGILAGVASAGFLWRVLVTIYHLIPKPFMGT